MSDFIFKVKKPLTIKSGTGVSLSETNTPFTEKSFDETININLKAPFLLSNLLSKGMVRRKYGKIINIGDSVGSYKTWKDYSHYCLSKG